MINTSLIGIAGVHHVVSELSRRGLIALPTVKNTAAYDIVALRNLCKSQDSETDSDQREPTRRSAAWSKPHWT
jgi:hypothetical protein